MAEQPINEEVWICVDCYEDHHEGRAMKDQSVFWSDNGDEDGSESTRDFSSAPCECCGSTLGGTRHRMAIWEL